MTEAEAPDLGGLEKRRGILDELYNDLPPSKIKYLSRQSALRQENADQKELVYAEVPLEIIDRIFAYLTENSLLREGGVFVDLGAGAGKCVFASSLYFGGSSCIGIETIAEMHELSKQLLEKFKPEMQENLPEGFPRSDIDFINGDFIEELPKLQDVSVALMFSTLFSTETQMKVLESATSLEPGTIFITFTQKFPENDSWELLHSEQMATSYGSLTFFIHRRIKPPEEEVEAEVEENEETAA